MCVAGWGRWWVVGGAGALLPVRGRSQWGGRVVAIVRRRGAEHVRAGGGVVEWRA